ncbi:hypothetical protein D3C76_1466480 [compost metagenome]
MHLVEADGRKDGGQVGAQKVGLSGTRPIDVATGSNGDIDRSIHQRTDLPSAGAQERLAHAHYMVNPGLERGGHAVVVHWSGNQQYVALLQLIDECVRTVQRPLLFSR